MNSARSMLILAGTMILLCCLPAAPAGGKERLRISVETVEAFVQAIGPERTILLRPGDYVLKAPENLRIPYSGWEKDVHEHAKWKKTYSGMELIIHDVRDLKIIGDSTANTLLIGPYSSDQVLTFVNTEEITLENISVGHADEIDECSGCVVYFQHARNIRVSGARLYGSGSTGLVLSDVHSLIFSDSVITGCTSGILASKASSELEFRNADFTSNAGGISISGSSKLLFENCNIQDNWTDFGEALFLAEKSRGVLISSSTMNGNRFPLLFDIDPETTARLEKTTITGNQMDYFVRGKLGESECSFENNALKRAKYRAESSRDYYQAYEYVTDQQPGDPDFQIIPVDGKDGGESGVIGISIEGGPVISLGKAGEYFGIDRNSIRVHRLPGKPSLLHIEWLDQLQGNGAYRSCYFLVCREKKPSESLLKDVVSVSGHWGSGWFVPGDHRLEYKDSILSLKLREGIEKLSMTPFVETQAESEEEPPYSRVVETETERQYIVSDDGFVLKNTLLRYHIQTGDTIEGIVEELRIKKEWIVPGQPLKPGQWLEIHIPL